MASPGKLQERILGEAREKAAAILRVAEEEAAKLRAAGSGKALAAAAKIRERGEAQAQERARRIITLAQLELRREVLAAKQELVDEVFAQVMGKLANLPDKEYLAWMEQRLLQAVVTGDEEVIVAAKDRKRLNGKFLTRVNEKLRQAGKKGELKLSEEARPMTGGFILKGERMEINSSFEALIASQRDELEQLAAEVLFE